MIPSSLALSSYRTLGRSGLVVSPLALGTMTFGTTRWGTDELTSRAIFDAFVDAGGNFLDTADVYSGGRSEEMLGRFIADRKLRDQVVIATKSGFAAGKNVSNGGSGAKHIHAALEGSLRRLATSFIDLYWLHVWDGVTPAEDLLETMTGLVRAGKIRHWGLSNAPAWYVSKLATLALTRGLPAPIALQYFYSLVNRDVEEEFLPLAADAGMAMVPWSPLAFGLLTGKYVRAEVEAAASRAGGHPTHAAVPSDQRPEHDKRLNGPNPFGDTLFTERNWRILDVLKQVAQEAGQSPARVALAWVVGRPGVTSTIIGVSKPEQVVDNIAALDVQLSPENRQKLDQVSASADPRMLYTLFAPGTRQHVVFGGNKVNA